MKLVLDEMWPPEVALQLRRRGHDVAAVAERTDLRGRPDPVVFALVQAEERAVVTENVSDYRQLAAHEIHQGRRHHGLILTTNRRFPRHDARTAGRLVTALEDPEMSAVFEELIGGSYLRGKAEGKAEGKRELVRALAAMRFGTVPPDLAERINAADAADLDALFNQVAQAQHVEDL